MLIERIFTGGYCISEVVNGCLMTRRYFYYTKREAVRLFNKEKRE